MVSESLRGFRFCHIPALAPRRLLPLPLSLDELQFGGLIFLGGSDDDNMLLTGAGEFESCRIVGE